MTLAEKQAVLTARLAALPDAQQRLNLLVDEARARPRLPAELRTDERRLAGCLAPVWFVAEARDGRCHFRVDSDSLIIKGIAGLLCDFYSGATAEEMAGCPPDFLAPYGIQQHLTPNRRNALARLWQEMVNFAWKARGAA